MTKPSLLSRYFAFLERRSMGDRLAFHLVLALVIGSLLYVGLTVNNSYTTSVPTAGGTLTEGIVGTPRFVNPVLAVTRADLDMVALIYSGLMKIGTDGQLTPDLASAVTVSDDGRTYHVTLRNDQYFTNGSPVTAKDVAYTIGLIQNPDLKSPLRGNWDGVLVEELGEYELNIVIKEAYAPFMENLTVGILPRDIWDDLPTEQLPFSQHNTEPVGSGPYYVRDVLHNKSGLINGYTLAASTYASSKPNISTIVVRFFQNQTDLVAALEDGTIHSTASLDAENLAALTVDSYKAIEIPLPRTFGTFFNQNKSAALRDAAARSALAAAIDRDALVHDVLLDHGIPTNTPVPPTFSAVESTSTKPANTTVDRIETAKAILVAGDWTTNENGRWTKEIGDETVTLSLTISTANTPLFDQTATAIAAWWRELGVEVNVDQYEQTDLVQTIIRPRSFQVLLFGNELGRALDLYPFWHSSQKDDPGLNVTQYANIDTDALLNRIRLATSSDERDRSISRFVDILEEEKPAVFLFSPTFTYVLDNEVVTAPFTHLGSPSDRFANIADWHITNERLWPIFTKDE